MRNPVFCGTIQIGTFTIGTWGGVTVSDLVDICPDYQDEVCMVEVLAHLKIFPPPVDCPPMFERHRIALYIVDSLFPRLSLVPLVILMVQVAVLSLCDYFELN